MANIFPVKLSDFIQNFDKSFWNGKGTVSLTLKELVTIIENNPKITVSLLKQERTQKGLSPVIYSGIKISAGDNKAITLGETGGVSLAVDFNAAINAGLTVVLSPEGLQQLPTPPSDTIKNLLGQYVTLSDDDGILLLSVDGSLNAGVDGSSTVTPGLNVGFTFKGGASAECALCRPISGNDCFYDAIRNAFSHIRLPQTNLLHLTEKGLPANLAKNELLYCNYQGFLKLGANASFGYSFNGTKNYSLGKLGLATQLLLQAEAKLSLAYEMAGAFKITVRQGDTPEWLRVAVEKNHTSVFDFAFGVTINASLSTPGTDMGGLPLVEAIIGTSAGQVLDKALSYGTMTTEALRQKADYFTQALVEKMVPKGMDKLFAAIPAETMEKIFSTLQKAEEIYKNIDDDLVALYEKLLDKTPIPELLDKVRGIFQKYDPESIKQQLLEKIKSPEIRTLIEQLAGQTIGSVITRIENIYQYLYKRFQQFDELVNGKAQEAIRNFIQAKKEALHLNTLMDELAKYDTPEKLKAQATTAVKGVVQRLLDKPFDKIFSDKKVNELVTDVNTFAKGFQDTLQKVGNLVQKALNAKGRFDLSYEYQHSSKKDKLVDIQYHIGSAANPDQQGMTLYNQGVKGNFAEVLKDEYIEAGTVKIETASFTEAVQKKHTLNVHIFGWDYQGVSSMLTNLDLSVKVGGTGLVTVYKLTIKGEKVTSSKKRATQLNYMIQLVGTVKGVYTSTADFKKRAVDAFQQLKSLQDSYSYVIKDNLASLDELATYFDLAVRLGLIDSVKQENLLNTIKQFRMQEPSSGDYMKVSVKYSGSYDGNDLATALSTDFSKLPGYKNTGSNEAALEKIFVQELLNDPVAESYKSSDEIALDTLYRKGIFEDFKKNPNLPWSSSYAYRITLTAGDGKKLHVDVNRMHFEWARILYFRNVWFAEFVTKFQKALVSGKKMKLKDLQRGLKELAKKAENMGEGPAYLHGLSLMVLDEMVRLANAGKPKSGTVLMEIILYDKTGEKELSYIPISS